MSATQELIAAALTACDLLSKGDEVAYRAKRDLREACARAMVQPAGDVSMPEPAKRTYTNASNSSAVRKGYAMSGELKDEWWSKGQMRTYGDAREAAGYAAGVAAYQDALADACCAAEIPDSKYESLMIALRGEEK